MGHGRYRICRSSNGIVRPCGGDDDLEQAVRAARKLVSDSKDTTAQAHAWVTDSENPDEGPLAQFRIHSITGCVEGTYPKVAA